MVAAETRLAPRAAALAPQAAHLEDVGEIVVEAAIGEAKIDRLIAVVAHREALVGGGAPDKDRAHDVDGVLLQHDAIVDVNVRIGLVDRQQSIVVAQVRAQQQELRAVEQNLQAREKPRVGVE